MIDAGVNTVESENALKLGFAAKGLFVESVERILVTHGHPDHYGLVHLIKEMSGAESFMGKEELQRLTDSRLSWELGRLLLQAGFPQDLLEAMGGKTRRWERIHNVKHLACKPVSAGDVFEFRDFVLQAIDLPGHTGGHLGYLDADSGTLFAGDTLLPHISPNPLMEPEGEPPSRRRPSLKQYLESLDRLDALDLEIVYPGHGPPITDPKAVIQYMREHHQRRLEVVLGCLDGKGKTPYAVSRELYPEAKDYDYFLAVSEVVAHLDVLVEQRQASLDVRDGVEYFVAV